MVKLPKSTPFNNEAIEGKNSMGSIFLKLYLEMENINKKFTTVPIIICGCFSTNGMRNAINPIDTI